MTAEESALRVTRALAGEPATPPVVGLTFSPPEALAAVAPDCGGDPGGCLGAVAEALRLDFVFVPASAPWAVGFAAKAPCAVLWQVDGPLWPALAGPDPLERLADTVRAPAALVGALDRETARAAAQVDEGLRLGVAAVVVADDLAGSGGPIVPPAFAAAEVLPRMAALVAAASEAETPAVLHSDGEVSSMLPDIRAAGFAALHGGGALGWDGFRHLYRAVRAQGLSLVGGIDTGDLGLGPVGTTALGTRLAVLAAAGGLLIADDGGISTPAEMAAYASVLGATR